jgi:hypothetical protein
VTAFVRIVNSRLHAFNPTGPCSVDRVLDHNDYEQLETEETELASIGAASTASVKCRDTRRSGVALSQELAMTVLMDAFESLRLEQRL